MSDVQRIEFEFIEPIQRATSIRGEEVTFSPLTVAELPAFSRAVKPLLALAPAIAAVGGATGDEAGALLVEAVVAAVADHGNELIKAVALAARRPVDWVGALHMDELVALASLSIQVNLDFFGRALPAALGVIEQLKAPPAIAL